MRTIILLIAIISITSLKCCNHSNDFSSEIVVNRLVYYPEDSISLEFELLIEVEYEPYSLKWIEPDTFKGTGPFTVNINEDLLLDVLISDAEGYQFEFMQVILKDTIDSLKYDYRNVYYGEYDCEVFFDDYYNGNDSSYKEIVTITRDESFTYLTFNSNYRARFDYLTGYFYHNRMRGRFLPDDSILFHRWISPEPIFETWSYRGKKIN